MGVIDALSDGYRTVIRRPYLILIPILLDLVIWLLPPISVQVPSLRSVGATVAAQETAAFSFDISGLAGLFVPSIAALATALDAGKTPIELTGIGSALGMGLVLIAGGVVVATVYLLLLAKVVTMDEDGLGVTDLVMSKARSLLGLTFGAGALIAVGGALLLFLVGGLAAVAMSVPGILGAPLMLVSFVISVTLLIALLAALLIMYFAVLALVLEPLTVRSSIRRSVEFLRRNPRAAIGFAVLAFVIEFGLGLIWGRLSEAGPGLMVSVLGSAFVGTGITAASMIFYLSRLPKPEESGNPRGLQA